MPNIHNIGVAEVFEEFRIYLEGEYNCFLVIRKEKQVMIPKIVSLHFWNASYEFLRRK